MRGHPPSLLDRRRHRGGPHLLAPAEGISIVPGKLAGEPHVRDTRIETRVLSALWETRLPGCKSSGGLYPDASDASIKRAIRLERQLQRKRIQTGSMSRPRKAVFPARSGLFPIRPIPNPCPTSNSTPFGKSTPTSPGDHEDWEVLREIKSRGGADGLITLDAGMLNQAKEMVVLKQTRLTLVVFRGHKQRSARRGRSADAPRAGKSPGASTGGGRKLWVLRKSPASPQSPLAGASKALAYARVDLTGGTGTSRSEFRRTPCCGAHLPRGRWPPRVSPFPSRPARGAPWTMSRGWPPRWRL